MSVTDLRVWCHRARFTVAMVSLFLLSVCSVIAQSQTPSVMFQHATMTGSGNTMTATRVPVRLSASLTVYVDVTVKFDLDSSGNLTISTGFPQAVPSATLLAGNFKAGTYAGPSTMFNGKGFITVSGPGVADGGATTWSFMASSGADSRTAPATATWYVGPIANSPHVARLTKAGITSTAWSYGVASDSNNTSTWGRGTLIGVSQSGNAITVASFTYFGSDSSAPVDQVTFTLVP